MSNKSTVSVLWNFSTFSRGHHPKGKSLPSRVFLRAFENEGNAMPKPTKQLDLLPSTIAVTKLRSAFLI